MNKNIAGFITLLCLFGFVVYFIAFSHPIKHSLPWHTRGNYFTIEWIVPENVAYYRCYLANNKDRITKDPFGCFSIKMPPPLKPGKKQHRIINYKLEKFPYDIYVEVFAFDIDGNYWNIELLNFEEEFNL